MGAHDLAVLVRGVRLLCLDAGNTVIFLDHARLARWASARGVSLDAASLIRTEGEAKRLQEEQGMLDVEWVGRERPGAAGWGRMVGTMLHRAGVDRDTVTSFLPALWEDHVRRNLWSLVPEGLGPALDAARDTGVKVAIVSNSEGMLDPLFVELGVRAHFDLVLDSGKIGIEKPDRRIFDKAREAFGVKEDETLHLGDSIATDVEGAEAAGIRVGLIDPYGHATGRRPDVPRVSGVVEVARALASQRRARHEE